MRRKTWEPKDAQLPLVIKDSPWYFIHDFNTTQLCKGVLLLSNSAHQIKYVGCSHNNCLSDVLSVAIESGFDHKTTMVKALYTQSDKDAQMIANVLIEKYQPANNSIVQETLSKKIS
ncbi:MAG: hypothetical protein IPM71_02830 [Bacteroidota bacterium]|nr:MAG: hypothetical protein IPM71_02830 [Bacteroidota bacterium]